MEASYSCMHYTQGRNWVLPALFTSARRNSDAIEACLHTATQLGASCRKNLSLFSYDCSHSSSDDGLGGSWSAVTSYDVTTVTYAQETDDSRKVACLVAFG